MTREIQLTRGYVALVDDADYPRVCHIKWYAHNMGYAYNKKHGLMHRLICPPPEGFELDHINRNGFDNRRCNLRICTHQENMWNRRLRKNQHGYAGVKYRYDASHYVAKIRLPNGKDLYLGHADTAEAAAQLYAEAVRKYHGQFVPQALSASL